MTTLVATEQQTFLQHLTEVFSSHEASLNGKAGSALHNVQKAAFHALQETSFPDRKHEDWKYTSIARLLSPKYTLAKPATQVAFADIPDFDSYVLQIINGRLVPGETETLLSSKGLRIIPIHEAYGMKEWQETFASMVSANTGDANFAFDFLNFSFNTHGFFLDIPAHTKLDKPIELRIAHEDALVSFSHPLYFVRFGSGSETTILERFETNQASKSAPQDGFINSVGFFHVDPNARVTHVKWQNLAWNQHMVYKLLVTQHRDSHFETLAFDHGGHLIRNNVEIELEDSNTYTSLQAGFMAKGKQSMDHQTRINHKVPHCESHELYRGIIDDQASAAFNGKVYVHPDAQKTNAFQQNDALVLSPFALMNSKPQLEIYADDVKCSHGATIGQLDDKAVFYLKSRGMNTAAATALLKAAFLEVVLDKIPIEPVRHYIATQMTSPS